MTSTPPAAPGPAPTPAPNPGPAAVFAGRHVVVTGAASGIGAAVASRLSAAGALVHSLDRHDPGEAGVEVHRHVRVDLADPEAIRGALEALEQPEDGFAALLCVAGVPGTAPAPTVLAVNALAVRELSEAFLDRLTPAGSVTIISSIAGFGWPERLETIKELLATDTYEEGVAWCAEHPQEGNAYNFSKEVATVYTLTMGLAFADLGLRINALLPGPVETPILADFEETMGRDNLDGLRELLGRHAAPGEIAEAALFLASPWASWVNGQAVIADGGVSGAVFTGLVPAPEI